MLGHCTSSPLGGRVLETIPIVSRVSQEELLKLWNSFVIEVDLELGL